MLHLIGHAKRRRFVVKKLITISVFLAIVVGFAVFELCYDRVNYQSVRASLEQLETALIRNESDVTVSEVKQKYDEAMSKWKKISDLSMAITNHNIIRSVSEKFVYLGSYIDADVYSDALSTVNVLIKATSDLEREKYPSLGNIF